MKRLFLLGVIVLFAIAASGRAMAADVFGAFTNGLPTAWVEGPTCDPYVDYNCTPSKAAMALKSSVNGPCDPYVDYKCLDAYLGDNPAVRFFRYYELEWGKGVARPILRLRPGGVPTQFGRPRRNRARRCRSPNGPMAARKISA
jgi:hypothetical protein